MKASIKLFEKLFTAVDGGYIYYPSTKSGGKFVTSGEYHHLVARWSKIASAYSLLKTVGIILLVLFLWTSLIEFARIPSWTIYVFAIMIAIGLSNWLRWECQAPRRLVKNRPEVAPPRTPAEIKDLRQAGLAAYSWWLVAFILIYSGGAFVACMKSADGSLHSWLWIAGSATLFAVYVWLAIRKLSAAKLS